MKQKVVKFAPVHERLLRRLCIKSQFIANIEARGIDAGKWAVHSVEKHYDWKSLIDAAFIWDFTPEGRDFWAGIANHKTRK